MSADISSRPPTDASPAAGPSLLAFDTSTESLSVALLHGAHRLASDEAGGALASARLLPCIEALLASADVRLQALSAVAFGSGPGAFTGLRTSAAVAQGLAFGAGLSVLPLDSLMIVAEDARWQLEASGAPTANITVRVCMDARMDEVYTGLYRWQGRQWQVLRPPALHTLADLAGIDTPADVVCGSALQAFGERLVLPATAQRLPQLHHRAAALLRVAEQAWQAGAALAAEQALPLYLRDKVAMTTAERELLRAAKAGAAA
jgi:tRNA threonylcarbamoyladenosine biosynthesis protein TsaB